MPSRRKSAHTTKIERVPRYEVYHGEEDLDDRLSSDGTLDLSMKRIKVEPPDYGDGGDDLKLPPEKPPEMDSASSAQPQGEAEVVAGEPTGGESGEEQSASSCDRKIDIKDSESTADDAQASASAGSDHMTAQPEAKTQSSPAESTTAETIITSVTGVNAANGTPLFPYTSKGKPVRPFKLYTTNRDLLSGLSTQGAPTLATYSVPIALTTAVPGAVPLAFASVPLVNGTPMIPVTASSASTSAASSAEAMGAGADASSTSTSSLTSSATAKSTSSTTDAHLMTLATEADKILRERHGSGESSLGSNQDSLEGKTSESICSNGSDNDNSMVIGDEGGVLKIPSVGKTSASNGDGSNSLSFIQKRAVAAAVAATHPHKSKKKRQPLPDGMKDIAYWERRRKNNEAAKRSRDARRAKEDQIAIRAALLEQENIRLKIEVAALKEETAKLRSRLYSNNNS